MTTYDKADDQRLIADRPTDSDHASWDQDHYMSEARLYLNLLSGQLSAAVILVDTLTRRAQVAELELEAMRPVVAAVMSSPLKHGLLGKGGAGGCYPDCVKCARDVYRSTSEQRNDQIAKLAGDAPR